MACAMTVVVFAGILWLDSAPVRMLFIEWAVYAVLLFAAIGWFVWFTLILVARWVRPFSLLAVPWFAMLAIVIVTIVMVVDEVPATFRFEMSKTALESAANRAQSGAQVAPGFIGLTPIDKVDPQPDGSTLLYVSDARTLLTPCGLVYNPHGVPNVESFHDSAGGYSVSDSSFATNWWLFCENY